MKKVFSLMALLLVAMFVTACGGEEEKAAARTAPAADVKVITQAYLHGDEASLQKIGMTKEEYEKKFLDEFAESFTKSSGLNFTPEQIDKISAATREMLSRSTFEVADVSTNGDNATVKVTLSTLTPFDENAMLAKLPENAASLSDTERMDAVATILSEILKEWQYGDNAEFNVECKYSEQDKMWVPVDVEQFGTTLIQKLSDM